MQTIAGITVPDELYTEGRAHKSAGGIALLAILAGYPTCANCGGAEKIGLTLLYGEGHRYPSERGAHHFHDGMWFKSTTRTWPCPMCASDDRLGIVEARLSTSGLVETEYSWSFGYAADMKGKELAVGAVGDLVGDTTRPAGWVFLYGDNGMGKSGLLKGAVAAMCKCGVSAYYTTAEKILDEIYDMMQRARRGDDEAESIRELTGRYGRYQLLAIDEIGADRVADTQFALSKLFAVVDERYNRRSTLATILASNQAPAQLEKDSRWRYFESRTRDGARVPIGGDSLRGRKP